MSEDNNHSKNLGSTDTQPNPVLTPAVKEQRSLWRQLSGPALLALPLLLLVPLLTDTCRHCALNHTSAAIALLSDQLSDLSPRSAADQKADSQFSADRQSGSHTLAKSAPGSCETLAFAVVETGQGSSAYCTIGGGGRCGDLDEITANAGHFTPSPEFQGICLFQANPTPY